MKIGIVYIGHLRNNHVKCFYNIKEKLLDNLEENGCQYDIFIHTWDRYNVKNNKSVSYSDLELYKPKKYIIEKQRFSLIKNLNYRDKKNKMAYKSISYQLYALNQVYKHFTELKNYDYIFKLRPDVYLTDNFYHISLDIFHNTIYYLDYKDNIFIDVFYFGDSHIMLKTFNIFNYDKYKEDLFNPNNLPAEIIYKKYWKYLNINMVSIGNFTDLIKLYK